MLKRRYGNRPDWKRIIQRKYAQVQLDSNTFSGSITLLKMEKVAAPLFVDYGDKNVCIVDNGYMWLQQFPSGKNHSVTTMFDSVGEIVQWYIDICRENGEENGTPYWDDLFLDIVALPSGEIILKDADELEEALENGIVDRALYKLAWVETNKIIKLMNEGTFELIEMSFFHKGILEGRLL